LKTREAKKKKRKQVVCVSKLIDEKELQEGKEKSRDESYLHNVPMYNTQPPT